MGGRLEIERERDRVEAGFMLGPGYRDGQAAAPGLPIQGEERAARALDGDHLVDEIVVYVLVEIDYQAASGLLDQLSALSRLAVALQLQAQPRLVKRAACRDGKWVHAR